MQKRREGGSMFRPKRRSDDFRFPHFLGATYLPRSRITVVVECCHCVERLAGSETDRHALYALFICHIRPGGPLGGRAGMMTVVRARSDNVFLFLCARVSKRIVTILEGGEFV